MLDIKPFTPSDNLEMLVNASLDEEYNFLKKLQVGINNRTNPFEGDNELLLCVKNSDGEVIAVGGIQVDPYEQDSRIGRLRHLYVHPDYRRHKFGKNILESLLVFAKNHFDEVRPKTPYEGYDNIASKFYEANGFKRCYLEKYSHVNK